MSLDRAPVLPSAWLLVHYMALRHSVASVFASEALPCNEERLVLSICLARFDGEAFAVHRLAFGVGLLVSKCISRGDG